MSNETRKILSGKQRPPIVVVMGHVDHGKTTLLDHIRRANVAGREAGGITQAVGAYEIIHNGRKITFIDTPGHEAFSAMRSRGAQAADLAILVVAADEGVKPQTKEAIKILEETKTPFVVVINKIDKTGGSVEKAKNDLAMANVFLEGHGGSVSYQGISAKTGDGIDALLDLTLLAADLEELSYDPAAGASGYVLEAWRGSQRGLEASVIVKNGTLRRGDMIQTPTAKGKVKILEDFLGHPVSSLEPSAPAIIAGFETLPSVGEEFSVGEANDQGPATGGKEEKKIWKLGGAAANGKELNLLLKASDGGSLEALAGVLAQIGARDEKGIFVVGEGIGDVTDGDVRNAIANNATIIGFKNRVEKGAQNLAEAQGVTVITSKIVYELADAITEILAGKRGPQAVGKLEVLAVFNQGKLDKQLIGGRVTEGVIRGKASSDILRAAEGGGLEPVASGKIVSLREKKSELTQAEKGKEIGLVVNAATLIKVGDVLVVKK
jgi:translation initiation factor IF-2